jgi:hypothetical protein
MNVSLTARFVRAKEFYKLHQSLRPGKFTRLLSYIKLTAHLKMLHFRARYCRSTLVERNAACASHKLVTTEMSVRECVLSFPGSESSIQSRLRRIRQAKEGQIGKQFSERDGSINDLSS